MQKNRLQDRYDAAIKSALAIAATLQLASYLFSQNAHLPKWVSAKYGWALGLVHVSLGPYVAYLLLRLYKRTAWKWFDPELDFSGEWKFTDRIFKLSADGYVEQAQFEGELMIQQTPSGLSVFGQNRSLEGVPRSTWRSTSCEICSDGESIAMSLEHTRWIVKDGTHADATFAVEIIRVVTWRPTLFGGRRPYELHGTVYHCLKEHERSFVVETDYKRAS